MDDDFDLDNNGTGALAQAMHEAQHDGPSDTLWVETCRRRPCRDILLPALLGQSVL